MTPEEIQAAIAKGIADGTRANKDAADTAAAELAKFKREAKDKEDAAAADTLKLKNENAALKLQNETEAAARKAEKVKMQRASANAILEAGVRAKKITPADRLLYSKLLKVEDDESILVLDMKDVEAVAKISQEEAVKVMGAGKSAFSRDPKSHGGGDSARNESNEDEHAAFQDEFTQAVFERAKETGKTTFSCMADVVRLNPKLGKRLLNDSFETGDAA